MLCKDHVKYEENMEQNLAVLDTELQHRIVWIEGLHLELTV